LGTGESAFRPAAKIAAYDSNHADAEHFKQVCLFGLEPKAMATLNRLSLVELEDLATNLRHTIARDPEHSRMEQVELEDVKQWIAIPQNRDSESEP
jgi:hypothetical protein